MQKREKAGGTKGQIWAAKTAARRVGDKENWRNYVREIIMVDTGYHGMQAEKFVYKNPEAARVNDTTLQQAGQQTTVSVVNQSTTQNISTASSSSKQNNVGQTQQSIPISNTHGAAPASV